MAETKTETPAASGNLHIEDKFHLWFEKNRATVILSCLVVILAAGAYIVVHWKRSETETAAKQAMAKAGSVEAWMKVVDTYPDSKVAPRALLLAADRNFNQNRYEEAVKAYERFLRTYPRDPFAASAQFGIAACMEAQAKSPDDHARAAAAYESLLATYRDTIHAGEANLGIARCMEAQGALEQAAQRLENTMASLGHTQWGREAAARLAILKRKLKPSAPAEPSIPSLVLPPTGGAAPAPAPPPAETPK